ncbi:MAG TPA: ATP-binding protein [Pyrinomonadaceae bacterium]
MVIENKNGYQYARPCICRLEKVRRNRLALIPPAFAGLTLSTVAPNPAKHSGQAAAFEQLENEPEANYYLAGRFGSGKTLMMWLLYREAVMRDQRVVFATLTELLNEYKKYIQDSIAGNPTTAPRIVAEDLRQSHTKYAVFLDDIDKAKPTEYAAEQLFELSNAVCDFRHQIVITTNLTITKLVDHFDRADERFGGAIVRRLVENSKRIELF